MTILRLCPPEPAVDEELLDAPLADDATVVAAAWLAKELRFECLMDRWRAASSGGVRQQ